MSRFLACCAAFTVLASLSAFPQNGAKFPLYFHDRHSLAFLAFASCSVESDRLVLIDAHHDLGPGPGGRLLKGISSLPPEARRSMAQVRIQDLSVRSYNWAGASLLSGMTREILWIPLMEDARRDQAAWNAWMDRSLAEDVRDDRDFKKQRVRVLGLEELLSVPIRVPYILSLDMDFFVGVGEAAAKGDVIAIHGFCAPSPPILMTVAFSSAYQKEPDTAWRLFEYVIETFSDISRPIFQARFSPPIAESREEARAWDAWKAQRTGDSRSAPAFRPGLALWQNAPAPFRSLCTELRVAAEDEWAARLLSAWQGRPADVEPRD
jgi:hypothetical protein